MHVSAQLTFVALCSCIVDAAVTVNQKVRADAQAANSRRDSRSSNKLSLSRPHFLGLSAPCQKAVWRRRKLCRLCTVCLTLKAGNSGEHLADSALNRPAKAETLSSHQRGFPQCVQRRDVPGVLAGSLGKVLATLS